MEHHSNHSNVAVSKSRLETVQPFIKMTYWTSTCACTELCCFVLLIICVVFVHRISKEVENCGETIDRDWFNSRV